MTRNTFAFLNPEEDITLCDANLPNICTVVTHIIYFRIFFARVIYYSDFLFALLYNVGILA